MIVSLLSIIIFVVCVLLGVAFVTLFERHLLSISQNRLGPNKVILFGIAQPVFDGIKLIMKWPLSFFNFFIYFLGPAVAFVLMTLEWTTLPMPFENICFNHSILFFLCCVGFMVYTTLVSGVASGSKYSFIGGVRSVCQTVSYEVTIILLLLVVLCHFHSFSFNDSFMVMWWFFLPFWVICLLAETNRAPFDFAEGESELVSGFNTEYSSVPFVLLFLSEYGSIIFLSYLSSSIWFGGSQLVGAFFFFLVILVRSSFPRFRYDFLMKLAWFILLPSTIFVLSLSLML